MATSYNSRQSNDVSNEVHSQSNVQDINPSQAFQCNHQHPLYEPDWGLQIPSATPFPTGSLRTVSQGDQSRPMPYDVQPSTQDSFHYLCTFCRKKFATLKAWETHEKGTHLPEEVYICQHCDPDATHAKIEGGGKALYAIEAKGTFQHVRVSSLAERITKSAFGVVIAKTFKQKEKFQDHLKVEHGLHVSNPEMTYLAGRVSTVACGLCDTVFKDKKQRMGHVRRHYEFDRVLSWDNARMVRNLKGIDWGQNNIAKAWNDLREDMIANPYFLRSNRVSTARVLHEILAIGFEAAEALALDARESAFQAVGPEIATAVLHDEDFRTGAKVSKQAQARTAETSSLDSHQNSPFEESRESFQYQGMWPIQAPNASMYGNQSPDLDWDC